MRAIYGFARLVDNLGDEAHGDRVVLLEELERELDGPRRTEIMQRLHETIETCRLPLEPFRRLVEDRSLSSEIESVASAIADGSLVAAVELQAGELA